MPSAPHHDDVVVVRWPEQRADAERLARLERPHLLLVEPGVAPPVLQGCLADWIRLPADDADVRARLTALAARSLIHPAVPVVDEFGELSFRGTARVPLTDRSAARRTARRIVRPRRARQRALRTDLERRGCVDQSSGARIASPQAHPAPWSGDHVHPRFRLPVAPRAHAGAITRSSPSSRGGRQPNSPRHPGRAPRGKGRGRARGSRTSPGGRRRDHRRRDHRSFRVRLGAQQRGIADARATRRHLVAARGRARDGSRRARRRGPAPRSPSRSSA